MIVFYLQFPAQFPRIFLEASFWARSDTWARALKGTVSLSFPHTWQRWFLLIYEDGELHQFFLPFFPAIIIKASSSFLFHSSDHFPFPQRKQNNSVCLCLQLRARLKLQTWRIWGRNLILHSAEKLESMSSWESIADGWEKMAIN